MEFILMYSLKMQSFLLHAHLHPWISLYKEEMTLKDLKVYVSLISRLHKKKVSRGLWKQHKDFIAEQNHLPRS